MKYKLYFPKSRKNGAHSTILLWQHCTKSLKCVRFSLIKIYNYCCRFGFPLYEHVSLADDEILGSLHRYRPEFLVKSDGLPSYYDANNFQHTCHLMSDQNENAGALVINKRLEQDPGIRKCIAVPFLGQNDFLENKVAKSLASVVKEVLLFFP